MVGKERRRVQATQNAIAVGASGFTDITVDDTVNMHAIRASVAIEPDAADANAHGTWVLESKVEQGGVFLDPTLANINLEQRTQSVIAIGSWACSNQTPYMFEVAPKTSRNLSRGGVLRLSVNVQGLTAGNLIVTTVLTCFVRQM